MPDKKPVSRKKKLVVTELTPDTGLIACGFTFGNIFRDFFRQQTGEENFKFNVDMVATAKAVKENGDESFTLGDLLDIYYGKKTYAVYDKSALQWNRFVKDFCEDEATKIIDTRLKAAAALWKIVRESDMKKEYSRELFDTYKHVVSGKVTMSDVVFDRANKDDIPELIRLRIEYIIDDYGSISEQERRSMKEHLPDYFERRLGKELIVFVARAEKRLVAAAYLLIIEKPSNPSMLNGLVGEVFSVFTEREYRGKGISTRLMNDMIAYAKDKCLCHIDLKATDEGYPLYKKLGFEDKSQKYIDMRLNL